MLLALLVSILPDAVPGNPATYISYKDVHTRLRLNQRGQTFGQSLKHQGLSSLANWTASENKPAITGLIISENELMPGNGYFSLFRKSPDDFDWWAGQIRLSKEFDWNPYLQDSMIPKTPSATDIAGPPERVKATVYRILRDTKVAVRVKQLHEHRCQLCNSTIELPDGSLYAEAHHIRPLGKPHSGPDVPGNILCRCPNHHVEMDYGVRPLILERLRTVSGHDVDPVFCEYHNKEIFGPRTN